MLRIDDLGRPVAAFLGEAGLTPYRLRLTATAEVTPPPVMSTTSFSDDGVPAPRTGASEQTWQYQALVPVSEMLRLSVISGIPLSTMLRPGCEWQVWEPGRDWITVQVVKDPINSGANWLLTLEIEGTI